MSTPEDMAEEHAKTRLDQSYSFARDRLRGIMDLALLGLRSLLVLNGGAIVSLFTILGHVSEIGVRADRLGASFLMFVAGLALVMFAMLFGFLSQNEFFEVDYLQAERIFHELKTGRPQPHISKKARRGTVLWRTSIVLTVLSLAAFVAGSACALSAVRHLSPHHT